MTEQLEAFEAPAGGTSALTDVLCGEVGQPAFKRLESVWIGKDNGLLDAMFDFYAPEAKLVIDVCCNARRMWKGARWGERVTYYDRDPAMNPDRVVEWHNMPDADGTVDVLVYDPPHLPDAAASPQSLARYGRDYGLGKGVKADNVGELHAPFLAEARRVLKPDGLIFAKIKDYVHNHRAAVREAGMTPCRITLRFTGATTNMTKNSAVSSRPVGPLVMRRVAVLFARDDSVYKQLEGVEVYDIARDARTYDGPYPVVAHPPCRGWGRLKHMASPRPDERNLARLAVALVREFGGVLEHPSASALWPAQGLPKPGERDQFEGWTLAAPQKWWGHEAEKRTLFYIVGCEPRDIPPLPLVLGEAKAIVGTSGRRSDGTRLGGRREISKVGREHTPLDLALWLVELARRCKAHNYK